MNEMLPDIISNGILFNASALPKCEKKIQQTSHFNDISVIVFSKNVYLRISHNNSCFQF